MHVWWGPKNLWIGILAQGESFCCWHSRQKPEFHFSTDSVTNLRRPSCKTITMPSGKNCSIFTKISLQKWWEIDSRLSQVTTISRSVNLEMNLVTEWKPSQKPEILCDPSTASVDKPESDSQLLAKSYPYPLLRYTSQMRVLCYGFCIFFWVNFVLIKHKLCYKWF